MVSFFKKCATYSAFLIAFWASAGTETHIDADQASATKCIENFLKVSIQKRDNESVAQARMDLWNQWTKLKNTQNEANREDLFKETIAKIKNLWDMEGTKWNPSPDGKSLIIRSDPKGSYLNQMAASMEKNRDGTRLVLTPSELLNRGGGYNRPSNSIYMPIEVLSHPEEGMAMVAHEARHQYFWSELNHGSHNFLYGWFSSKADGAYSNLEELFTYPLELRVYSSILKGADHFPSESEVGNIAARRTLQLSQLGRDKIAKPIKTLTDKWLPKLRSIQREDLSGWSLTQWTEKIDGHNVQVRGIKGPDGCIIAFHRAPLPFNPIAQNSGDPLAVHVGLYSKDDFLRLWLVNPNHKKIVQAFTNLDSRFARSDLRLSRMDMETLKPVIERLIEDTQKLNETAKTAELGLKNIHEKVSSGDYDALAKETSNLISQVRNQVAK